MEFSALPATIADKISSFFFAVRDAGLKAGSIAGPIARDIASRIESLVTHLKPLWQATATFIASNLGMATISLGAAVSAIAISRGIHSPLYKTAWIASSLALAVVSGLFLASSGILPNNILPI